MPRELFNNLGDQYVKAKMSQTLVSIVPSITKKDIQTGIKTRYFAKYTTQRNGTIYEIDGGQYAYISNNPLFTITTIDWIIRGRLEDRVLTLSGGTSILIKGVLSQNKELLSIAEAELSGITNHLRNYMEFWIGE